MYTVLAGSWPSSIVGAELRVPIVPQAVLQEIASRARARLREDPMVLRVPARVTVVGDVHGQHGDLLLILHDVGLPPARKYLFLSDLVDRGCFSLELFTLVLLLKVKHPQHVYIVRGNHEFVAPGLDHAEFLDECISTYGRRAGLEVFELLCEVWPWMPIAAKIGPFAVAMHGGIGPSVSLVALDQVARPLPAWDRELVADAVWSDPGDGAARFKESGRGHGKVFGEVATAAFLRREGVKLLIRAHSAISEGVLWQHRGLCVTVFSAAGYEDDNEAPGGILHLDGDWATADVFPPLPARTRRMVSFVGMPSVAPNGGSRPPRARSDASPSGGRGRAACRRIGPLSPG
jgi:diadenosine tetraphosphatase ApaH/serine/threonine PP2A family protein phosphatase